ncbi:MAG: DUF58 domain-containing protein [Dehalococcoidia bacterium]|nr:DUF58 domain-containing protein [Dehalococcoidia bacterium]
MPLAIVERVRAIGIQARRLVDELFLGEYHAVFRGRGIEFDELRPYIPGDDTRDIDWKTFARSGQVFVRRYREDRQLTVLFAVDVSASQHAGSLERTKLDMAAEVCAVLALAAIRNDDRVGLLLFASEPERYIRPASGSRHVLRVVREMLGARGRSRGTGIGPALEYLVDVHRRSATVFLVSDFLTGGYERELRAACLRHDVVPVCVREPVDEELPDVGIARLADAETGELVEVDTSDRRTRDAYRDHVRALDDERRRIQGALGLDAIELRVGQDYAAELLKFFRRRAARVA